MPTKLLRHLFYVSVVLIATSVVLSGCSQPQVMLSPQTSPAPAVPCTLSPVTHPGQVTIDHIEVTQALDLGEPLVPEHSTAVIVHVTPLTGTVPVMGRLRVCRSNQLLEEQTTVSITLAASDELVFGPLRYGDDVSLQLDILNGSEPSQVLASQATTATFGLLTATPYHFYVRVNFEPSGQGAPPDELVGSPNGDAFARAVLPIDAGHWQYRAVNDSRIQDLFAIEPIGPITITVGDRACDCDDPNCTYGACQIEIDDDAILEYFVPKEYMVVFRRLSEIRQRIQAPAGFGMHELLFVHGWIHDPEGKKVVELNGAAKMSTERIGYGTTNPEIGQLIYVHELLHNFIDPVSGLGFGHVPVAPVLATLGWDVDSLLPGSWANNGLNLGDQRKASYFPIMSHQSTANSWISPDEYRAAARYLSSDAERRVDLVFSIDCPREYDYWYGRSGPSLPCTIENNYVLSGALESPGPFELGKEMEFSVAAAFPVSQIPWRTQPTSTYTNFAKSAPEALAFYLEFMSEAGNLDPIRIPFDPTVTTFVTGEEALDGTEYLGYFEVVVPASVVQAFDFVDIVYDVTKQRLRFLDVEDYQQNTSAPFIPEPLILQE
jgi:hypothetical protein